MTGIMKRVVGKYGSPEVEGTLRQKAAAWMVPTGPGLRHVGDAYDRLFRRS